MSGQIAKVMKDIATKIGRALGHDLSQAEQKLLHTTGDNLDQSVAAHVEHDAKAAANLERAASGDHHVPTVHGGGAGPAPAVGGRGPGTEPPPDLPDTSGWPYQPRANVPPEMYRTYRPYGNGTKADYDAAYTTPDGRTVWPPDDDEVLAGGLRRTREIDPPLPEGYVLDRFGPERGDFLGRGGDPFENRSLPTYALGNEYHRYAITGTPLPAGYHVEQAQVAPWFGQPGGGTQFRVLDPEGMTVSVKELRRLGWLRDAG